MAFVAITWSADVDLTRDAAVWFLILIPCTSCGPLSDSNSRFMSVTHLQPLVALDAAVPSIYYLFIQAFLHRAQSSLSDSFFHIILTALWDKLG